MATLRISRNAIILMALLLIIIFVATIAFAIPNSITLQGKLTSQSGTSQQGTYNFTFKIYDAATGGSVLWHQSDVNITTDANGIYDIDLKNLNLSFADQYYLGVTIRTDNESVPRINLTASPYSFRANTSEVLNSGSSYAVTNLSISSNLNASTAFVGTGPFIPQSSTLHVAGTANLTSNSMSFLLTSDGNVVFHLE